MANRVSKRLARLDKHKSATRRFPPPWTVEQIPGGYKVKEANGQSLAYVYGRETKLTPTSPTSSPWTRLDASPATCQAAKLRLLAAIGRDCKVCI